ncbi:quinone-dependent dihydroorotate dehydrogenase [Acidomonas methanolica]|uniref:quinone-dependent dihydroorotate dehydrogenase n=1 Tax=Acidomonas methanolica TaxID=437 RepID=UPI001C051FE2|nr:quinone-dependent dihydroorotate dehydrogenase [Acidomonas methanolica]MBU2655113.1 quinone-dependent dihydroorotate dehydrogenase [Acidomonas methanolica]
MSLLDTLPVSLLRRLDPETAHETAIHALALGLTPFAPHDVPQLATRALGLRFPNPIGLAAGFDKDARAIRPLARLGFGFVEAGTVTPRPQQGNPRPRLFRLTEDRAIINRMGFNGCGIDRFCRRLARLHRPRPNGGPHGVGRTPIGANLGINKTGADPLRDYPELVARVSPYVDYITINLSSPNTPGLRDLQSAAFLAAMLDAVAARNPHRPPLLIKLAPDLPPDVLGSVIEAAIAHKADGLILGNTTISRPAGLRDLHATESGGLSGRPLRPLAIDMLRRAADLAQGRLILVACGGIETGRDILDRLLAGADLVQVYSAFIFEGPALLPRLKRELLDAMRKQGFETVVDARTAGKRA